MDEKSFSCDLNTKFPFVRRKDGWREEEKSSLGGFHGALKDALLDLKGVICVELKW